MEYDTGDVTAVTSLMFTKCFKKQLPALRRQTIHLIFKTPFD